MTRLIILISILHSATAFGSSQSIDNLIREGITYQLQGDYKAASAVAATLKRLTPESAIGEALELNSLATQLSWNPDDRRIDAALEQNAASALELCKQRLSTHPDDADMLYRCGQANFSLAFLRGVRGRLVNAGALGTRAIGQFEEALALNPDYIDPKLQLGMAYFYADNLPSFVRVLATFLWFIPSGDSEKSLPYVKDVLDGGEHFADVAKFVYADIATASEAVPLKEAEQLLTELTNSYPQNSRMHLALISIKGRLGDTEGALAAARRTLDVATLVPERELLTRLWLVHSLIELDRFEEAIIAFDETAVPDEYFPDWGLPRYHVVAGQIADLQGDRDSAVQNYQLALDAIGRYRSPAMEAIATAGVEAPLVAD